MKLTSIRDDVDLGNNAYVASFVNLYGCKIGDDVKIGAFVEIQKNVQVGDRCKVQSHSFLCEGVILESEVFVGHGVIFINDKYPRSTTGSGSVQSEDDWSITQTHVKHRASIGSNSTVLCGVTIGEGAIVGAGSVVTKDVAPHTVVAGNPARFLRRADND